MRLIVVRHGETKENSKKILMGHRHGTLSRKGVRQARETSLRLSHEKIDIIFSSDLRRAKLTAKEIARYHNAPIVYTKHLREQNYGVLQGHHLPELLAELARVRGPKLNYRPDGGESIRDVRKRVVRFLDQLSTKRKYRNKTLLLSSHSGVASIIFSRYGNTPLSEVMKMKPRNAGFFTAQIRRNGSIITQDKMFGTSEKTNK